MRFAYKSKNNINVYFPDMPKKPIGNRFTEFAAEEVNCLS
jgi:hypothetical protein